MSPLINIDHVLNTLTTAQAAGNVLDGYVRAFAFNFIEVDRHPVFAIALVTHSEELWAQLLESCSWRCWLTREGCGIAVCEPQSDCGATRIYQWTPSAGQRRRYAKPYPARSDWRAFGSEEDLLAVLQGAGRPQVYQAWVAHQRKINEVPTQLARGRIGNTTVEQAVIFGRGNGCALCGSGASAFAGTTVADGRLFIQLPLCQAHIEQAKAAPNVLSLVAELLHAKIDLPELQRLDHIPDDKIAPIVEFLTSHMDAVASVPEKRSNGWHVVLTRRSGWAWVLRLRALNDYAYMLFDPQGKERHRIDSAADHPDIPFGPAHQHSRPGSKKDSVSPSFTYGIPLFDSVILNGTVERHELGNPLT